MDDEVGEEIGVTGGRRDEEAGGIRGESKEERKHKTLVCNI
jgi:hypothetical protein